MFSYISSYLSDPKAMLIMLLLAFPGRILAISCHEYAHAWVADRCGDPTARNLGRLTINPFAHLDLVGALMMILIGFGWAKPVPVNPRNYRNLYRDDLKVSLAGIAANLILFLIGYIAMVIIAIIALKRVPVSVSAVLADSDVCVTSYMGQQVLLSGQYYLPIKTLWQYVCSSSVSDMLIVPVLGQTAGYGYQMLMYFVEVNIVLAVFNLLPVPPLDGWHVVNDFLVVRRRRALKKASDPSQVPYRQLFASPQTVRIAMGVLMALVITGLLGTGLGYVIRWIYGGMGSGVNALLSLLNIL